MGTKIEFQKCLNKNNLRTSTDAKRFTAKEIKAAEVDLHEAQAGSERHCPALHYLLHTFKIVV